MKDRLILFSLVLFGFMFLAPRPALAHEAGAMLVDIPSQMKLGDVVLHGQYLIVHIQEDSVEHETPCTYVYEYKTKRLVTKFRCVHLDKTTAPAAQPQVIASGMGQGMKEITSFQFRGSTEPIGVPGIVNGV
jgi:hypothetical protein